MSDRMFGRLGPWLLTLVVVALASVLALTTDDERPREVDRSPAIGETIKVDTADPDTARDTVIQLTERAEDVAQRFVDDPRDLKSTGAVPLEGSGPQKGLGVIPAPLAADQVTGCRTRFLPTNFSSRGVAPSRVVLFELHFTAGSDIPGSRAEVDGLTAFGSRAASRVSWHFNMDKDGNCDYNVPLRLKSWTIADLNAYTINVEVAGRGEAPYLREAGYRKLAAIISEVRRAYPGIKLRVGASSNCHPTLGGIDTHWRGGACSGGHTDIKPIDLVAVIQKLRSYTRPISERQRKRCQDLNRIRAKARPPGRQLTDREQARAARIRGGFKRYRLRCIPPGDGKSGRIVRR